MVANVVGPEPEIPNNHTARTAVQSSARPSPIRSGKSSLVRSAQTDACRRDDQGQDPDIRTAMRRNPKRQGPGPSKPADRTSATRLRLLFVPDVPRDELCGRGP